MVRAGQGVHGGAAKYKHGWIPVDPAVAASMARIRAARARKSPDLMAEVKASGGFTYDPKTGGLLKVGVDKGFAVAVPGTEEMIGSGPNVDRASLIEGVKTVIRKHGKEIAQGSVLGGWYSPDRDAYMVELTHILSPDDRAAAIREGKRRNQEAIFDLSTGETIPTGGTGG